MRWTEAFLALVGLWLALAPDAWGWRQLGGTVGEERLLRFFLGFTILFVAWLILVKSRLVRDMRELLRALRRERFGETDSKREAVEILIRAASSPKEDVAKTALDNLARLTGQSFGSDVGAWQRWWRDNRDTFRFQGGNGGARTGDEDEAGSMG